MISKIRSTYVYLLINPKKSRYMGMIRSEQNALSVFLDADGKDKVYYSAMYFMDKHKPNEPRD